MNISLIQSNPKAGNIKANATALSELYYENTLDAKSDLLVFGGEALCGYPVYSLANSNLFELELEEKMKELASSFTVPTLLCCLGRFYLIYEGEVEQIEDSFDFKGKKFALSVSHDLSELTKKMAFSFSSCDYLINFDVTPYVYSRQDEIVELLSSVAKRDKVQVLNASHIGLTDGIIHSGQSLIVNEDDVYAMADFFGSDVITNYSGRILKTWPKNQQRAWWSSLVCGLRNFKEQFGFNGVVLGLSGGMDSALVATIATEAVGRDNVLAILMPSPYSSKGSVDDALKLVKNLGIKSHTITISNLMNEFDANLSGLFASYQKDVTEENIQARIRGSILMSISNKFNMLVANTGNKSEASVGYCTLYGDTCGALGVITDLYKTEVYELARAYNEWCGKEIIPNEILVKDPSAELRENQKDQDKLPSYEVLDSILKSIMENRKLDDGISQDEFNYVELLFKKSEFKRRQAPPAICLSESTLGLKYKMPM